MTDVFPDPREQFLAQDPWELKDPYQLTPDEEQSVEAVRGGVSKTTVAAGLGAAYLVYRGYMSRQMKRRLSAANGEVGPGPLMVAASAVWNAFVPKWVSMTAPYLVAGYLEGIQEAKAGTVPVEYLEAIAEGYARDLGHHLNEVSKEGLLSGYQSLVNRKVPPLMAARRTADAYGITRRGMNTLVNVWTMVEDKKYSDQVLPSAKEDRAKAFMEHQHQLRARQIGDNEEWAARTQAKQVVWMYGTNHGVIPSTARRVWITAADERVCEICGPLDGKSAPVGEKFTTSAGKVWTPPTHVNCRCDVALDLSEGIDDEITALLEAERVSKAAPGDPFDRDKRGRFARTETRSAKVKEREAGVDALLAQVNRALSTPVSLQPPERPSLTPPSLSLKPPSLSAPSLKAVPLGDSGAPKLKASLRTRLSAGLDRPKLSLKLNPSIWEPVKIRQEDIDTNEGHWEYMDTVLTTVMDPWQHHDIGDTIMHDDVTPFYEDQRQGEIFDPEGLNPRTLNEAIGDYWERWITTQMEEYRLGSATGKNLYYDEGTDSNWAVPEDAYQAMLEDLVNGTKPINEEVVELEGLNEHKGDTLTVTTGDMAKFFRMREQMDNDSPVLMQTKHGMPGVTEKLRGHEWRNPGRWRVVNIREVWDPHETDYHHLGYTILEVEPADLYGER